MQRLENTILFAQNPLTCAYFTKASSSKQSTVVELKLICSNHDCLHCTKQWRTPSETLYARIESDLCLISIIVCQNQCSTQKLFLSRQSRRMRAENMRLQTCILCPLYSLVLMISNNCTELICQQSNHSHVNIRAAPDFTITLFLIFFVRRHRKPRKYFVKSPKIFDVHRNDNLLCENNEQRKYMNCDLLN